MGLDATAWALAMQARGFEQQRDGSWAPKKNGDVPEQPKSAGVDRESKLQADIVEWAARQWPVWKVFRARMDKRSTLEPGTPDMVIFGPFPIVLVIECKTATGKQTGEQLAWACQMRALGWTVHVIRSMEQFRAIAGGKV